jgi:hypothetical protein
LTWATFDQGNLAFTTGQVRVFDLLADTNFPAGHAGLTIVRTEYQLLFSNTDATHFWTYGTYVTRLADVGGSEPSPISRPDTWWLWLDRVLPSYSGATVNANEPRRVTSLTKRRIHGDSDTYVISVSNGAASTQVASLYVRTLVALP